MAQSHRMKASNYPTQTIRSAATMALPVSVLVGMDAVLNITLIGDICNPDYRLLATQANCRSGLTLLLAVNDKQKNCFGGWSVALGLNHTASAGPKTTSV